MPGEPVNIQEIYPDAYRKLCERLQSLEQQHIAAHKEYEQALFQKENVITCKEYIIKYGRPPTLQERQEALEKVRMCKAKIASLNIEITKTRLAFFDLWNKYYQSLRGGAL